MGSRAHPVCSADARTPSWWRSSGAPGRRRRDAPPSSTPRPIVDLHQMLEEQTPDLVSLCLPNEHHFETTMQTIEAGFPLLVEKPFVFDLEESKRLLAEAEERSLFFAINFNHRYAVPVIRARAAIENERAGQDRVRYLEIWWRTRDERAPSCQPHRNPMSRFRHARAPLRPDRQRDGADGRQTSPVAGTRRWPSL